MSDQTKRIIATKIIALNAGKATDLWSANSVTKEDAETGFQNGDYKILKTTS